MVLLAACLWTGTTLAVEPDKAAPPKEATSAKELVKPAAPASPDASKDKGDGENPAYAITVDTSDVPEMAEYGKKVQQLSQEWYPKLLDMLPSDGFRPHKTVKITINKTYKGVAAAGGNGIVAAQKWFTEHPEDLGAFIHELVHVVQSYRRVAPGGTRPPGWLVEGIADYIRFFRYEPESARPHPNPNSEETRYDASYRVTGHFLNWAQGKYDKDLVVKLNAACRQGKFSPDLWKQYTGKTVEELGAEWKESLKSEKK
jgi:hypothetical protein